MQNAYYPKYDTLTTPSLENLTSGLNIIADTNYELEGFIHPEVMKLMTDTWSAAHEVGFYYPGLKQAMGVLPEEDSLPVLYYAFSRLVESERRMHNERGYYIWVVNNSSDTITLSMQDRSFYCLLEGLNKKGKWQPLEYWYYSTCGNSYLSYPLAPGQATGFKAEMRIKGDYTTQLRYKLLEDPHGKPHYSNVFTGTVSYSAFQKPHGHWYSTFRHVK